MPYLGEGAALLAALCWTISGLTVERKGKGFSAWSLNFLTKLGGLVLVSLLVLIVNGRLLPPADKTQWLLLLLSGFMGFSFGDGFLFAAFQTLGAKKTLLIFAANPILTALFGFVFLGERLSISHILGILFAVLGIMWVIQADMQSVRKEGKKEDAKSQRKAYVTGLLFAALATLGQVAGVILSKAGMASLDAFSAAQIRLVGGTLGMVILLCFLRQWPGVIPVLKDKNGHLVLASSIILGTLIGMVMSMVAIKMTQVAVASILMSLMPIIILPISAFILKDRVTQREVYGALITLLGVALLILPI